MLSAVRRSPVLIMSLGLLASSLTGSQSDADSVDFDRQIAPLLAERCLSCHDAREKKGGLDLSRRKTAFDGGDSGVVLQPGKLDDSFLWQRVSDDEMPPKHPLSADEK